MPVEFQSFEFDGRGSQGERASVKSDALPNPEPLFLRIVAFSFSKLAAQFLYGTVEFTLRRHYSSPFHGEGCLSTRESWKTGGTPAPRGFPRISLGRIKVTRDLSSDKIRRKATSCSKPRPGRWGRGKSRK